MIILNYLIYFILKSEVYIRGVKMNLMVTDIRQVIINVLTFRHYRKGNATTCLRLVAPVIGKVLLPIQTWGYSTFNNIYIPHSFYNLLRQTKMYDSLAREVC